jgi:hypothetical protein
MPKNALKLIKIVKILIKTLEIIKNIMYNILVFTKGRVPLY